MTAFCPKNRAKQNDKVLAQEVIDLQPRLFGITRQKKESKFNIKTSFMVC